jgi:predicted phage terminase large subunit-like protein
VSHETRIDALESAAARLLAPAAGRAALPVAQPGPQTAFVESAADIAVFGGAAGAGKTLGLLLIAARHVENGRFRAVIFRRETPQIRNPGGLWDESVPLYGPLGAESLESVLEHRFVSGAVIKFAHLEHVDDVYGWDGAQVPMVAFDQLEHFEREQFFYMLSRNRDPSGSVRPFVRATCNPDPDSWLAEFLAWWIDPATGYPVAERAGKVRWFVRDDDAIVWADAREELVARYGAKAAPKSVAFIPGVVFDNKILLRRDPGYVANLLALPLVERERLLGGNWKVRASAGLMFRREWCAPLAAAPADLGEVVRYWDLAATQETASNDPDWTVGVKLGKYRGRNRWVILDVRRMRVSPAKVEEAMIKAAAADGREVRVGFPQDPGQAGKSQAEYLTGRLAGFTVWTWTERGDKATRFGPFSAQAEHGNVDYVRAAWNDEFFRALEAFPEGKHLDDADACSGAFASFTNTHLGVLDWARSEFEKLLGRRTAARKEAARGPGGEAVEDAGEPAPAGARIVSANLTDEEAKRPRNHFQFSPGVRPITERLKPKAITVAEREGLATAPEAPAPRAARAMTVAEREAASVPGHSPNDHEGSA